jgi:hypothetical protein
MLKSLVETIAGEYDASRHRDLLAALWEHERWFDTPHQRRAARVARDALGRAGLREPRIVPFAADGLTRWQDWTTHMAWECTAAQLSLGGQVLADRAACPQAVVQWSGPLAAVSAPVVDGDALAEISPERVRGKFVLTARPPRDMKERVRGAGAAGIISDYLGEAPLYDADTTRWCNTWGDGPDGWYFRAADAAMPGFCLSPRAGATLRQRMAADPDLLLTGRCDSRIYAGQSQCASALLPGRDDSREVWLFAHACEQGANDNASGVSVIIEAAGMLAALIDAGTLERPRFGIRVIVTEECLGMLAFASEHEALRRRAVVGLNVDSVGDLSEPHRPFRLFYGPLSAPTFAWAVAAMVGGLLREGGRGAYHLESLYQPPVADDMIADPNCGTPTLWLGRGKDSVGYHSSRDTPAICDGVSLRANCLLVAAWAYACAGLDDPLARRLAAPAVRWIDEHILPAAGEDALRLRRWAAGRMLRDLGRWDVPSAAYEPHASRYCPAGAGPLEGLTDSGPRLVRRTWGTSTFETLPPERSRQFSRWSLPQAVALYWNHGRLPLAAVERLTLAECGSLPEGGIMPLAEACIEARLADWA